jgi:hypothetical protein
MSIRGSYRHVGMAIIHGYRYLEHVQKRWLTTCGIADNACLSEARHGARELHKTADVSHRLSQRACRQD